MARLPASKPLGFYFFFPSFFLKAAMPTAPAPNKSRVAGSGTEAVGLLPEPGSVPFKPGLDSGLVAGDEAATRPLDEDRPPPPLEPKKPIA